MSAEINYSLKAFPFVLSHSFHNIVDNFSCVIKKSKIQWLRLCLFIRDFLWSHILQLWFSCWKLGYSYSITRSAVWIQSKSAQQHFCHPMHKNETLNRKNYQYCMSHQCTSSSVKRKKSTINIYSIQRRSNAHPVNDIRHQQSFCT